MIFLFKLRLELRRQFQAQAELSWNSPNLVVLVAVILKIGHISKGMRLNKMIPLTEVLERVHHALGDFSLL